MLITTEYLKFFAGLFSIVNVIGTIPIFINLTSNMDIKERQKAARIAAASSGAVLLATLVLGEKLLSFFGISIASFRIGGGLLLLLMAISMMHAKISPVKHIPEEAEDKADSDTVAVVPLGIPLLSGPGAISAVIIFTNRHSTLTHYLILGGTIIFISLLSWLILRGSALISKALGKTGINITTRIMGLILAAMGVEFIANGLKQLFPGLL